MLPPERIDIFRRQGLGVTPDLIYARGVPNVPNPNPSSFNKATCSLLLIEAGFVSDLNLKAKMEGKSHNTNLAWRKSRKNGAAP